MPATVRPAELIRKYYAAQPVAWEILLNHSRSVTRRALKVAHFLNIKETVDLQFIAEAAMLHDIGIIKTNTPDLDCHGEAPYLYHGIAGRALLEKEGLFRHALVCERHIGIGLTAAEIREQNLPLPPRDMLPISLEEQIICYADLFYSKGMKNREREKSPAKVRKSLQRYGPDKVATFDQWLYYFEPELS